MKPSQPFVNHAYRSKKSGVYDKKHEEAVSFSTYVEVTIEQKQKMGVQSL